MLHNWLPVTKILNFKNSGWDTLWRCNNCGSQWTQSRKPSEDFKLSFRDAKDISCEEIQELMAVKSVHES